MCLAHEIEVIKKAKFKLIGIGRNHIGIPTALRKNKFLLIIFYIEVFHIYHYLQQWVWGYDNYFGKSAFHNLFVFRHLLHIIDNKNSTKYNP